MPPRTAAVPTPASPPKRMTRARAARNIEVSEAPATTTRKETTVADKSTAPARGRPRTKTADAPTATKPAPRRKVASAASNTDGVDLKKQPAKRGRKKVPEEVHNTSAVDGDTSDDEMDIVTVKAKPKTAPSRKAAPASKTSTGRARKAAPALTTKGQEEPVTVDDDDDDDDDELAHPGLPKRRPGRPKTTSTTRKSKTAATQSSEKAPVGRPRKAATVTVDDGKKGTSKTIHISAASLAASSATSRARTAVATAPRKKVTFLDMATDSDKENQPIPSSTTTEPKQKIKIGIKAKPIRKTTPASDEVNSTVHAKEERKKEPLSPKKATQVARSGSSASSVDEAEYGDLGSPRPRISRHNRSPTKRDPQRPFDSPAKKIDFVSPTKPSSQVPSLPQGTQNEQPLFSCSIQDAISADSVMLSSPARKLPPSPYKKSMRDSPRRAPLQPAPLLSCAEAVDKREYSPLKISPKKGNLGASFSQSPFKSTSTPSKGKPTLLQSPAKRPPLPVKFLSGSTRGETPTRESITAVRNEETSPYHINPSVPLERSSTQLFDQTATKELKNDDVFTDCTFAFETSVLEARHSLGRASEDADGPILEEANDESHMTAPAQELDDPFVITEITSTPSTPASRYEICNPDSSVDSGRSYNCIPPAAPSPPVFIAKSPVQFVYRDDIVDESEDELMADASPLKLNNSQSRRETLFGATGEYDLRNTEEVSEEKLGFTPLAERLSQWGSTSPVKRRSSRIQGRGVFSPLKPSEAVKQEDRERHQGLEDLPQQLAFRLSTSSGIIAPTFFEDEMAVHHRESMDRAITPAELDSDMTRENGDSTMGQLFDGDDPHIAPEIHEDAEDDDEAFGDENAAPSKSTVPIDPRLFDEDVSHSENPGLVEKENSVPLPMSVTPVRSRVFPRTIHTVSKVPLRPDGDGSVLKVPRKRSRSLSSSPRKNSSLQLRKSKAVPTLSPRKGRISLKPSGGDISECEAESEQADETPVKYNTSTWPRPAGNSAKKSPSKPNPNNDKVLQGAVVFADVHTAEGADASGIFVELLIQMGARCVKSWSWNPRASLSPVDGVDPKEGKVGITHVVFKDGGVRTLEKVREANGLVKCVGVGWVLDCERKGKWLDEINYGVDVSLVPRGGQKRRKSMEPRALSNMNGSIIKLDSSTSSNSGKRNGAADRETFQELMRVSPTPPSSRRETREWDSPEPQQQQQQQHFAIQSTPTNPSRSTAASPSSEAETPTTPDFNYAFDFDGASAPSPITPYYPSQGTQLAQQTCPPKQLRQGLFDDNGRGDSQMSEGLKIRLEAARRRSLVWKPKVGSPLGRPGMKF
ncbi:hypothetical protein EMPG_16022 [Blastomyces silverae]|uniref:BRCT domain-containing protein n=1 Tax=Blastomyces silverae TaxID=2060906 RepID=A0A0H1BBZ6_9EURO|nr:hypothetical protein EMPG_16022 [Blastomyces silverae]